MRCPKCHGDGGMDFRCSRREEGHAENCTCEPCRECNGTGEVVECAECGEYHASDLECDCQRLVEHLDEIDASRKAHEAIWGKKETRP